MKTFYFLIASIALFFSFLLFPGCTGSNVGDVVCDYGGVVCDISTTLCTEIPGVPQEVCNYLDVACYNLDQLCSLRDSVDSPKYQAALIKLKAITEKLREWKTARDKTK